MTNNQINSYTISNANIPDNSVISVQIDATQKPWFASAAQGLFTDTGNQTWLSFNASNSDIPTNSLTCFSIDPNQNFLIGTLQNGIVLRFNNSNWLNLNTSNSPMPDNHVFSILGNDQNTLWIGTEIGGLVKLNLEENQLNEFNDNSLIIYPNPVSNGFPLHINGLNQNLGTRVYLTDLDGKYPIELFETSTTGTYPLPRLSSGIYFLHIHSTSYSIQKKIFIVE
jgi:ligand-binding sensor domain-containing protein